MCKDTTYTQSALWVQILKKKEQITVLRVGIYCLLIYSYKQLQWNKTTVATASVQLKSGTDQRCAFTEKCLK